MESLTESGVLWSLLLEQDSQPLQRRLEKLMDGPAGAELCCRPGSEEIPAVSAHPHFSAPCDRSAAPLSFSTWPCSLRGPRV